MGRGGAGGGGSRGFSGGGNRGFSSHSHSSFSSGRSSFSSGRSSFSSGHSSFSSSHSSRPRPSGGSRPSGFSYHPPRHTTHYSASPFLLGAMFGRATRTPSYRPSGGTVFRSPKATFSVGGFLIRTIKNIFIVLMILMILVAISSQTSMSDSGSSGKVTKSTVEREKLDPSMVTEIGEYYTDDLGWINSGSTLEKGMRSFYNKTGVQPYLYICDNINGDSSGKYTDIQEQLFGNEIYDSLFDDEGHILVVFCEYSYGNYVSFCVVGTSAKTVMDTEAREILLDYIDHYYYSDYDDDEYFSLAFEKAGEKIMTVEKSYGWVVWLVIVVIIGIVVILKRIETVHEKRLAAKEREKEILETPLGEFGSDSVEHLAGKYE